MTLRQDLLLDTLDLDNDCVRLLHVAQQQVHVLVKSHQRAHRPAPDTAGMPCHHIDALACCVPLGQHSQGANCCEGHDGGKGAKLDAGFCPLSGLQGALLEGCCFCLLGLSLRSSTVEQCGVRLVRGCWGVRGAAWLSDWQAEAEAAAANKVLTSAETGSCCCCCCCCCVSASGASTNGRHLLTLSSTGASGTGSGKFGVSSASAASNSGLVTSRRGSGPVPGASFVFSGCCNSLI